MGALDENSFEAIVAAGCPACQSAKVEIKSFIDRRVLLMLADPTDAGRWVHDGEKFVDGTYVIQCAACAKVLFESSSCPRCHAEGGLARALGVAIVHLVELLFAGTPDRDLLATRIRHFARLTNLTMNDLDLLLHLIRDRR